MRQKINLITLGVDDLNRSINFYEKGLGWKRSSASVGDVVFFQLGGIVLSLYPKKLLAEDATIPHEGNGFSGLTLSYNAKSEQEVEDVLRKLNF